MPSLRVRHADSWKRNCRSRARDQIDVQCFADPTHRRRWQGVGARPSKRGSRRVVGIQKRGQGLRIAVATPTTITRQNTPVGRVAPANGAARFEDGGGAVLAVTEPYTGSKADSARHHRILSPVGNETVCPRPDDGSHGLERYPERGHSIPAQPKRRQLEGAFSRCVAPTHGTGRSRVGGHIGRGVRRLHGLAPRVRRLTSLPSRQPTTAVDNQRRSCHIGRRITGQE